MSGLGQVCVRNFSNCLGWNEAVIILIIHPMLIMVLCSGINSVINQVA